MDNELLLFDRIEVIKETDQKYDLQHNAYLSFSGGKDSTILHYLLDLALPGNRIPRVFINTGIEYQYIAEFVKELASKDDRFVILQPIQPIKPMLEKYGYPFKSKEHSLRVHQFNKGLNSNYIKKYISGYDHNGKKSTFVCPKTLLYQFKEKGKYNYSNLCCFKLKKRSSSQMGKRK
jgi:3'-phosphoadenosine 5'-phosphosulfate sulfotransferase (PAPS reductase)/FAD synthetase